MSAPASQEATNQTQPPSQNEHPDAEYIKRDDIGVVVAKGLAVMYKTKPKHPVDFLAKWLLNYAQIEKKAQSQEERKTYVEQYRKQHEDQQNAQEQEKQEQEKHKELKEIIIDEFYQKIDQSKDLADQLQDLADFLKQFTNATAVYIGKLVQPKKPINEDDDDQAHIDEEAQKQIHYMYSTKEHQFMVDQILNQEQGLTFDVLKEEEEKQEDQQEQQQEEELEEGEEPKPQKEPEEQFPNHVYVKEVVREPRMHFYRVPKLGSYLAIKLEYDSCLFEGALDNAVTDYLDVTAKQKQQDEEKKAYYDSQQQEEEQENEEQKEEEEKVWEQFQPQPFQTEKVTYVVCLNTMGQDKEFSEEEKKFALRTAKEYKNKWEQTEKQNLEEDIQLRIQRMQKDKDYKENYEHLDNQELERRVEESVIQQEGQNPMDEEKKTEIQRKLRYQIMTQGFYYPQQQREQQEQEVSKSLEKDKPLSPQAQATTSQKEDKKDGKQEDKKDTPKDMKTEAKQDEKKEQQIENDTQTYQPLPPEQWKDQLLEFTNYHVIKLPRVFQSIFYLLGYSREDICERYTNKLSWKKAKQFINDSFFERIGSYQPFGPKDAEYKEYQKLKFIQKNIESIENEQVDEYSVALGKLFRWMEYAIELRKEDVQYRREQKQKLKEERETAIEASNERERNRQQDLENAQQEFELKQEAEEKTQELHEDQEEGEGEGEEKQKVEKPKFDEEGFLKKWDEENPPIQIPDEVVDDIDNDYNLEDEAEENKE